MAYFRQHNSPRRRPDLAENGRHSPHDRHQAYSEKHSRSSDDLVDRADQHERRPPHDRRNVHSEKHSRRRGSADELDQHRSSSERHRNLQTPQDGRRVHGNFFQVNGFAWHPFANSFPDFHGSDICTNENLCVT